MKCLFFYIYFCFFLLLENKQCYVFTCYVNKLISVGCVLSELWCERIVRVLLVSSLSIVSRANQQPTNNTNQFLTILQQALHNTNSSILNFKRPA